MAETQKSAVAVGVLVLLAVVVGLSFFWVSRKSTLKSSNSTPYYALLSDASGINAKSLVTVAGLQVGEIQNIKLVAVKQGDFSGHERKILEDAHAEKMRVFNERLTAWERGFKKRNPKAKVLEPPASLMKDRPRDLPTYNAERIMQVARVDLLIKSGIKVPEGSWLKKESLGVLGANALFLEPADPINPLIESGGRIVNVRSITKTNELIDRMESIVDTVDSIAGKLDEDIGGITSDIHGITSALDSFMQGGEGNPPLPELYGLVMKEVTRVTQTIERTVRDLDKMLVTNDGSISQLLANIERITNDIADITAPVEQKVGPDGKLVKNTGGDLRSMMSNINEITLDLSKITSTVNDLLGENEDEVSTGVKELKFTLGELNRSLTSLAEVTSRIEKGEGTVGRLLTDEQMADKLEDAIGGASDFVTGLTSLEAHVDMGTWYGARRGVSTAAFQLRLQPRPDKFYLLELVDDGGGIERLTQIFQEGDGEREVIRETNNSLRISAMFGKRFWDFLVLRAGLIETSGGVGANLMLFKDRFNLRTDVFNFGGPRNKLTDDQVDPRFDGFVLPRWRTMLKVQPIPHIYLMGGVDDVLNWQVNPSSTNFGFDYFFGVGLTFQDEDLRSILPFVPSF